MNTLWLALLLATPGAQLPPMPPSFADVVPKPPAFTAPAYPAIPPHLFTYGEIRKPNGIERYYAIGVAWYFSWDEAVCKVSATWHWEGSDVEQYTETSNTIYIPRIVGRATIYYGDRAWSQRVILEPMYD